jgi:hypothetical protein
MADTTVLPVPNQLKAQLQKCKTVRSADVRIHTQRIIETLATEKINMNDNTTMAKKENESNKRGGLILQIGYSICLFLP